MSLFLEDGQPTGLSFLAFWVFFIGLWLLITTMLHHAAGWPQLTRAFPDQRARVIARMHWVSGSMGDLPFGGVQYGNCLTLHICEEGLRVKVWRIFGPFSKPFLVPWPQITVSHRRLFFMSFCKLEFGIPVVGQLTLSRRAVKRISRESARRLDVPDRNATSY